jgi:hypothetical protein
MSIASASASNLFDDLSTELLALKIATSDQLTDAPDATL